MHLRQRIKSSSKVDYEEVYQVDQSILNSTEKRNLHMMKLLICMEGMREHLPYEEIEFD